MSLKNTQTEKNILTAFAGESQARNRYTYFASVAKKEGYEQISAVFLDTAENEKEHAKKLFKLLEGGEVEIQASYPAGTIGTTAENLKASSAGENHEYSQMYPDFAQIADQENLPEIAEIFRRIAQAEVGHEKRYLALLKNIEENKVFQKEAPVTWRCRNCGFIQENVTTAPNECPACNHPQAYFEIICENW